MKTHIVWDWDGTLADTYPVTNSAYAHTFKKLDMEDQTISFAEVKRITSTMQNKDILGCVFGEKKEEARKHFYEYIGENHAKALEPIKGSRHILDYCHQKKFNSYLLSNKTNKRIESQGREAYLTQELEQLDMKKYFSRVVGAGEHEEDKPSLVASKAILGNKDEFPTMDKNDLIIVIGDGEADMKVAQNYKEAGLNTVSVLYDPKGVYKGKISPDYVIKNLYSVAHVIHSAQKRSIDINKKKDKSQITPKKQSSR
ncbi:MAG: HAD family hydrolase [Alphaproteobacteria bacterium]